MTVKTILNKYGLKGQPCLMPAETVSSATLPVKPCTVNLGDID